MVRLKAAGQELVLLSPRETEVLTLLAAEGRENKEIAWALGISESAVKKLIGQMLEDLPCPNRTALATWAVTRPEVFAREAVSPEPYRLRVSAPGFLQGV